MSVIEPVFCPSTITDAPMTGSPSSWEITVPVTFVCAIAIPTKSSNADKSVIMRFSINCFNVFLSFLLKTAAKLGIINLICKYFM